MPAIRPWKSLSPTEQERIAHILGMLREFKYGYRQMEQVSQTAERGSTQYRFYLNALYGYVNSFFLVSGRPLTVAMTREGLEDLLPPIDAILDHPLGKTHLRHILRVFRDKMLAHPQFTFDHVERAVYDKFDMSVEANALLFSQPMSELMHAVDALFEQIAPRFPGILD